MKCEYPKKKKSIITNGKKFAIVKRRYKKIYHYPLKKTPLFYLLNKKNILNIIKNYEPSLIDSNIIEYELIDNNSNKVSFIIRNIKKNISIKNEIFKIPKEEDL